MVMDTTRTDLVALFAAVNRGGPVCMDRVRELCSAVVRVAREYPPHGDDQRRYARQCVTIANRLGCNPGPFIFQPVTVTGGTAEDAARAFARAAQQAQECMR